MFGLRHSLQWVVLYKSVGAGFMIGVYGCCFAVLRRVGLNARWQVFLQDLLFFAGAGVITFLFAFDYSASGVRFYLLFGEGIGALLFYLVPCRPMLAFFSKAADGLRRGARRLLFPAKQYFGGLIHKAAATIQRKKRQQKDVPEKRKKRKNREKTEPVSEQVPKRCKIRNKKQKK